MRSENPEGASVDPKTPDELTGATVLLDSDKTAGAAVKDDGYLTGVFKSNKRNKTKNAIGELTLLAIANGATHGDCYGAFLMNAYARYGGFVPVARVAYVRGFNPRMDAYVDAQRAKGKRGFATDPDIYFMVRPSEITVESVVDALENDTFKQYTIDELNALPLMEYGEAEALVENMLKEQATPSDSAADTTAPTTKTTEAASTEPAVQAEWDRLFNERAEKLNALFSEMEAKKATRHENNLTHSAIEAEYASKRNAILNQYKSKLKELEQAGALTHKQRDTSL